MCGKRKKMRRLALMIAAIMIISSLTGCQFGGSQKTDAEIKVPQEISVSVFDRGEVPTDEGSYADNRWTKWIDEQSGIKVKWVPIPRNEAQQKLNMLIAGGEAPDLMVEYDLNYINTLYTQGVIQPIDEYIEKYSTAYKEYAKTHPELKPFVTFDGKTYAFTNKRSIDTIANHAAWIRQDWLDKLNLKMPTTDEELFEVAKAFAQKDPDGNGKNDTTGISLMVWGETIGALYAANSLWYEENGKLVFGELTDRYADVLRFLKRLYQEKLVDQEFLTDKQSVNQKQLWVTGRAGILLNNWEEKLNRDLMQNVPDARPVPLEPVSTKYGKNGMWQEPIAQRYIVFSKSMKNPEAGVRFLDWMIDKGWYTLKFGLEGVHYKMVDGVPQEIDAQKNKKELSYALDYPILNQWELKPEWIPLMAAKDDLSQKLANQREESLKVAMKNKFRRDLPYLPPIPELTRINTEFGTKRDDIRMNVIIGGPNVTPEWGLQQTREEWGRLGGKDVEKLVNEWYQKNKDTLK